MTVQHAVPRHVCAYELSDVALIRSHRESVSASINFHYADFNHVVRCRNAAIDRAGSRVCMGTANAQVTPAGRLDFSGRRFRFRVALGGAGDTNGGCSRGRARSRGVFHVQCRVIRRNFRRDRWHCRDIVQTGPYNRPASRVIVHRDNNDSTRSLVVIFGPPAVGKMTVGLELERRTGLPLFHNHMSADPVLRYFDFGTPAFGRLVGDFRRHIFEEVAASDLPGLIFTYVWALDDARDRASVDRLTNIFTERGAQLCFVELKATLSERLLRNETRLRLEHKAPKRDLVRSREHLLASDSQYQLNSNGDFFYPDRHIQIENTELSPQQVATRVMEHFHLPARRL